MDLKLGGYCSTKIDFCKEKNGAYYLCRCAFLATAFFHLPCHWSFSLFSIVLQLNVQTKQCWNRCCVGSSSSIPRPHSSLCSDVLSPLQVFPKSFISLDLDTIVLSSWIGRCAPKQLVCDYYYLFWNRGILLSNLYQLSVSSSLPFNCRMLARIYLSKICSQSLGFCWSTFASMQFLGDCTAPARWFLTSLWEFDKAAHTL